MRRIHDSTPGRCSEISPRAVDIDRDRRDQNANSDPWTIRVEKQI